MAEQGASAGVDGEPVGSLAQETVRLLRALAAERMNVHADARVETDEDAQVETDSSPVGEHVCTTGWCPVCQVVGYVHDNPELLDQVAGTVTDAAVQVGRVIRDFLDKTLPPEK